MQNPYNCKMCENALRAFKNGEAFANAIPTPMYCDAFVVAGRLLNESAIEPKGCNVEFYKKLSF